MNDASLLKATTVTGTSDVKSALKILEIVSWNISSLSARTPQSLSLTLPTMLKCFVRRLSQFSCPMAAVASNNNNGNAKYLPRGRNGIICPPPSGTIKRDAFQGVNLTQKPQLRLSRGPG